MRWADQHSSCLSVRLCLWSSQAADHHCPYAPIGWALCSDVRAVMMAGVPDRHRLKCWSSDDSHPIGWPPITVVIFAHGFQSRIGIGLDDSNDLYSSDEHKTDGKREPSTGRVERLVSTGRDMSWAKGSSAWNSKLLKKRMGSNEGRLHAVDPG